jgi:hypothetical protein
MAFITILRKTVHQVGFIYKYHYGFDVIHLDNITLFL